MIAERVLATNGFMESMESALYGKRILIVQAAYDDKLPIYEQARSLGAKLVVLDGPGHWAPAYVARGLFEKFIEVDLRNDGTRLERALAAIRASGLTFDAVTTFWELATVLAAEIAQALRLPGHRVESVTMARNKYQTRMACLAHGIPVPRFAHINSPRDLTDAAEAIGFPAVLKPSVGASSIKGYRVDDIRELTSRYQQNALIQIPATGAERSNGANHAIQKPTWQPDRELMLEEFLDGDKFDIDCLLSHGELVYSSVIGEDIRSDLTEAGAYVPAIYPEDKQAELVALAEQVLAALNFTNGVFHVEVKYTSQGPRLLEVNAQIGDKFIYQVNKLVWGVDLAVEHLLTCLGLPVRPEKADPPLTYLAVGQLIPPYSGTINGTGWLDHLRSDPRIVRVIDQIPPIGQHVNGSDNGTPASMGEIIVYGESSEKAQQILQQMLRTVRFPILAD